MPNIENDARCSCGNRFDGDNLCMVSACQWEGLEDQRPTADYDAGHPLHGVPVEVLQAARGVLTEASVWKDVDADQAEPLADAVVIALLPWLDTTRPIPPVEKGQTDA